DYWATTQLGPGVIGLPATAACLIAAGSVLVMRRRPWLVVAAALTAFAVGRLTRFDSAVAYVLIAVACVGVAAWGRRAVLAVPAVGIVTLVAGSASEASGPATILYDVVLTTLVASLSTAIGLAARQQQQITDQLRTQHEQLDLLQRRETAAAIAIERGRISRELHDMVAHHVSALLLQARAGQRVAERSGSPEASHWGAVSEVAQEILGAMRHLVGLLRTDDPARPGELADLREPLPGLADLPALASAMARAGLDVELAVRGESGALPAEVDLGAYRIVQEALTNVMRHASATRASVRIDRDASLLRIEIGDNGHLDGEFRPGNGLLGMRERVAGLGGRLDLVANPGRGLRVYAELPSMSATAVPGA
ncbi:MAG: histidine kinase, partial [Phycicoccus sp.]